MEQINSKSNIIKYLCELLIENKNNEGVDFIKENYPFIEIDKVQSRQYSKYEMMKVFLRDGFIDRYSGERLLFPGLIRLLTLEMPDIFKYHPNWKMTETHMIYWDLFPTVDHIIPIARGGNNQEDNWITTSQLRNSAKSNFTIEELGWELLPNGKLEDWDGLCSIFLTLVNNENIVKKHFSKEDWKYISDWRDALLKVQSDLNPKSINKNVYKNKIKVENITEQINDLKNFPVGTISRNRNSGNRYVTLNRDKETLIYFSESENFTLKITTKPLLVNVEFAPDEAFNASSIVELPYEIYNAEQLQFITKACKSWCKGIFKRLSPRELPTNTIYQYLLKNNK